MNKIKLYKNNNLVFEKEGTKTNNIFEFENIRFDNLNNILIREDENFKYELDFKNNNAVVIIKSQNYTLNLLLTTKEIIKKENKVIIIYNIESDENSENKIEIELF